MEVLSDGSAVMTVSTFLTPVGQRYWKLVVTGSIGTYPPCSAAAS